ncbi:hypothetical protein ACWZEH_02285 [Streptomyces sp. QTS137]
MADVTMCPSCGEDEELRGESDEGDIRITCLSCNAQWMRGAPRCASCGGRDIVHRPQAMTRHSRGTQLSIIGWRELPLCRTCDAGALETSITQNVPVPSDYVAACLGAVRGRPATPGTPPTPPASAPKATPPSAPKPVPEGKSAAPAKSSPAQRTSARPRQSRPKTMPSPSMVPTVRQAIATFMTEASGQADATAMLLLGTRLGPHNRLNVLEEDGTADRLADWCHGHWGDGGDGAQRALGTICRAIDFWGARGWLASDPAAGLRSRND